MAGMAKSAKDVLEKDLVDLEAPEEYVPSDYLPGPYANVVRQMGLGKSSISREMMRLKMSDNEDKQLKQSPLLYGCDPLS